MAQAVGLEKKARELEAAGSLEAARRLEDAFREYKNSCQVFSYVHKWENNPRVKEMLKERLEELLTKAETIKKQLDGGAPPRPPPSGGAPELQRPPASAQGGAADSGSAEDAEQARLRKGLEGAIMTE